jgi:hypothetical protein
MGKGASWRANAGGDLKYSDRLAAYNGFRKAKIKPAKRQIAVGGKGAGVAMPALPLTPPLTTQLVQLDNGSCWESVFPAASKNDPGKFTAKIPCSDRPDRPDRRREGSSFMRFRMRLSYLRASFLLPLGFFWIDVSGRASGKVGTALELIRSSLHLACRPACSPPCSASAP